MADFAVWAPQRNRVRVQLDGVTYPMTPDGAGWWRAELEAPAGARYAYLLDDDPTPLPDPRSCRQPDGVPPLAQVRQRAGREADPARRGAGEQPAQLVGKIAHRRDYAERPTTLIRGV